ncbi:MAG TPA: hypothetical protein VE569_02375, partial [Acidimicrobiia bacterium]|nr:hypothetical protein [Acidimicrobiia bacterium]
PSKRENGRVVEHRPNGGRHMRSAMRGPLVFTRRRFSNVVRAVGVLGVPVVVVPARVGGSSQTK